MATASYWGGRYFGGRYFGSRYWGSYVPPAEPVDGAHFGNRYFGSRYFGKNYWSQNDREEDFALAETTGVSMAGSVTVAGNIVAGTELEIVETSGITLAGALYTQGDVSYENEDFSITPPIEVSAMAGALTVAGNLTIAAPAPGIGRYFGQRYFGHDYWGRRYWSPAENWSLEQTQGISISGTTTVAGGIGVAVGIAETTGISLSGAVALAGDVSSGQRTASSGNTWRGAKGAKRKAYSVKIDDEEFVVYSLKEAEKLLAEAVDTAKQQAEKTAERIVLLKGKAKREAIKEVRAELDPPKIVAPDLEAEAKAAEQRIAAAYVKAVEDAARRGREIEDDDEDVLLLL